jgi:hypothetical protein
LQHLFSQGLTSDSPVRSYDFSVTARNAASSRTAAAKKK